MTVANRFPFEIQWERVRETILAAGDEALLAVESNRRLFRSWLTGRHGEWMVPRSAFDIVDLGDLVGSLCVYDRDEARDDYLCRVFGGRVADDTGIDMTGHYISEFPSSLRQVVRAQYDQALALRRPVLGVWRATQVELWDPSLREEIQFLHETLILPVTRGGRSIDCFITHVARAPLATSAGEASANCGPKGALE